MKANHVVFTKRAFNAIVTETIDKNPVETGGIFIGYILDNGIWIVVETIPPGIDTVNERAYFEYDTEFINYLSNVVAKQYVGNLQVLGLWHRHPGSMDVFSSTDNETNILFANNSSYGAISCLVNCDPRMRLTMYGVDQQCNYTPIQWSVDDETLIPKELLKLQFSAEEDLPILNNKNNIINNDTDNHDEPSNEPEYRVESDGVVVKIEDISICKVLSAKLKKLFY